MPATNHQFRLAARPLGLPVPSDWNLTEQPLPDPREGELLVKIIYISIDPAMRGWMNEGRSYVPAVAIGDVMRAIAAGRVIASKHPGFADGDYVTGRFGVQEYAVANGDSVMKVDMSSAPLAAHLGVLGMSGMTAYFGLFEIGKPVSGEMVVVSSAAGAVGSVVGQLAKLKGCPVVGIAGGAEKCRYITQDLGFDAAIDYKNEDVRKSLVRCCPKGIDIYFDNVGGGTLDAVLAQIVLHARIVLCGAISQYNNTTAVKGPSNYLSLLINRASMTGMIVFDYADRFPEAVHQMSTCLAAGKLKHREHILEGFEKFPEALLMLFKGENTGKLLLKGADE